VLLNVSRDVVLIASNVNVTRLDVDMLIVLGLEEILELFNSNICLHPLLVDALRDVLNAVGFEPCTDDVDGGLLGSEQFDDLFGGEMLTESRTVVARARVPSVYLVSMV
jgi:hypothetical protein